jgi:hypothetical protein
MQLFQMAAKHNSKGVAEKLIQRHGAFLANVTDENGKNLVCLATENNSVAVLKVRSHCCLYMCYCNACKS